MPNRYEYMAVDCLSLDELNAYAAEGWRYLGRVELLQPDDDEALTESEQPCILLEREIPHPTDP